MSSGPGRCDTASWKRIGQTDTHMASNAGSQPPPPLTLLVSLILSPYCSLVAPPITSSNLLITHIVPLSMVPVVVPPYCPFTDHLYWSSHAHGRTFATRLLDPDTRCATSVTCFLDPHTWSPNTGPSFWLSLVVPLPPLPVPTSPSFDIPSPLYFPDGSFLLILLHP